MLPISVCRFARRRSCLGVSPQRFDCSFLVSESHGILRRGIISPPDGYSIVKVQVPSLVWNGKAVLLGCFEKFLPLYLFPLGKAVWGVL